MTVTYDSHGFATFQDASRRFELEPSEPGTGPGRRRPVGNDWRPAALATALVVAGVALSAGSSQSRTITACVKKSSGAARIVSSGTKCRSNRAPRELEAHRARRKAGAGGRAGSLGRAGSAGTARRERRPG